MTEDFLSPSPLKKGSDSKVTIECKNSSLGTYNNYTYRYTLKITINIIINGYNDYKVYCYYSSDVLLYCVIRLIFISEQF